MSLGLFSMREFAVRLFFGFFFQHFITVFLDLACTVCLCKQDNVFFYTTNL